MRSSVSLSVDFEADAAYITMSDAPVAATKQVNDEVLVDLDALGMVVGIEMLRIDGEIPFQRLLDDFHVHSTLVEQLRALRPSIAGHLASQVEGTTNVSGAFHQVVSA